MSLLAGFDFVFEFSPAALLTMLQSNATIAGSDLHVPFELSIPLAGTSLNGSCHIIVNALSLELHADTSVSITFVFSNASIITSSPPLTISLLDGQFVLKAPITLEFGNTAPFGGPEAGVILHLDEATVSPTFTSAAESRIQSGLIGSGLAVNQFKDVAKNQLTSFVHQLGPQGFGMIFSVIPGVDGAISPLQFERLEMRCIAPPGGSQSLVLLGILLAANHNNGNAQLKTSSGIPVGNDVSIHVGAGAFHSFFFCPAVASALNLGSGLPTSCGTAGSVSIAGGELTRLNDQFSFGFISISGTVKKAIFCATLIIDFNSILTFDVNGAELTPVQSPIATDSNLSVPWYCGPVTGFGSVGAFAAKEVTTAVLQSLIEDQLPKIQLPNQGISALPDITFKTAPIVPEGLSLNGVLAVPFIPPKKPGISLNGSVTTSNKEVSHKGTYTPVFPFCLSKEFPFTEYAQEQTGTYQVTPFLLGEPLTLEWWIVAADGVTKGLMPGSSGDVSFDSQTFYAQPLPAGVPVDQKVHLSYVKTGHVIQISNASAEGNFVFALHVKASDPTGKVVTSQIQVSIEGDAVEIGGGFPQYAADCMARYGEFLHNYRPHRDTKFTPWVPVNYPAPEQVIAYLLTIAASRAPGANEATGQALLAHRSIIYRALAAAPTIAIAD